MSAPPSWQELNAFVDNELAPESAARVAAAIADNPEVAGQVAALARLRAATATAAPQPPADLDALLETPEARRLARAQLVGAGPTPPPRRGRGALLTGLGLAASFALGMLLVDQPWRTAPERSAAEIAAPAPAESQAGTPSGDLASLLDRHRDWVEETRQTAPSAPPSAGELLVSLQASGLPLFVPDLTAAQLRVVSVRVEPARPEADEPASVQIGYKGQRGCSLSLFALARSDFAEELRLRPLQNGEAYTWRVGGIGYGLVASGMDRQRLALLARSAEAVTRAGSPLAPAEGSLMAQHPSATTPCRA